MLPHSGLAQTSRLLQFERPPGYTGINVFEPSKTDTTPFEGLRVRVGGDFSLIFQGIDQRNDLVGDTLRELASNFALPSANLNLAVQIEDGVHMYLRTYLSSRHHTEAWVKGGYFQIDKLDFIKEGFLEAVMKRISLRFGMDEINYGDLHFRRSDNARSLYNPFVGNYIMDGFTTEPFGEVLFQGAQGLIALVGVSNGRLNQRPTPGDDGLVVYAKLGVDRQISPEWRVRLTGSVYSSSDNSTRDYLYNGDRAGARYYNVLEGVNDARPSDFLPRFNPGFSYQTSYQINPFLKYSGLEFFGVLEFVENGNDQVGGGYTQVGGELLYRFGGWDQLYVGTRYNHVQGEATISSPQLEISRLNLGGGWFMTPNVLLKVEYVRGEYQGPGWQGTKFQGAEFDGLNLEAVIGF